MNADTYTYDVKCRTCRIGFKVALLESHEKNLFLVDKKDWYCEECKKNYFRKQTEKLAKAHQDIGYPELEGTVKMVSWAEKIRAEMISKVKYLRESLKFDTEDEKKLSEQRFELFLMAWRDKASAKWWIDHRKMTVRDISITISKISEARKAETAPPVET